MTKIWTAENVSESLQKIKKASNCHVPVTQMEERGNCFYCNDCKLNVYHFSNLTNAEIATLLNSNNEKLCIGMFKREDGTVITKDCPLGLADLGFIYRKAGLIKAVSFLILVLLGSAITTKVAYGYFSVKLEALTGSVYQGAENLLRDEVPREKKHNKSH